MSESISQVLPTSIPGLSIPTPKRDMATGHIEDGINRGIPLIPQLW